MRWPFTKCDVIYLCLLLYYILFNLARWSTYSGCAAPVQIFLVAAQFTFFVMIICLTLLKAADLPDNARKWITYAIHWIMNPICVYLPIQGAIWQIKNIYNSPTCPAVKTFSFSIWTWIFCVFVVGVLFSYISYLKVKHWWRIYQFRRRMLHLNHMVANGDYDRLSELLLSDGDINDKVGLMPSDIEKLEKKEYQSGTSGLLQVLQETTCPICYEDFKPGDQTVALPKCDHTFHPECVTGWLLKSPLCPMCRGNVRNGLYNLTPQTPQGQNEQYRALQDLESGHVN